MITFGTVKRPTEETLHLNTYKAKLSTVSSQRPPLNTRAQVVLLPEAHAGSTLMHLSSSLLFFTTKQDGPIWKSPDLS
jgi:hypothetical protein